MQSCKMFVLKDYIGSIRSRTIHQIDNAIRQSCLLKNLHNQMSRINSCFRRFPNHCVSHQCRCTWQISRNRCEIKWRQSKNKPFNRTPHHSVPYSCRGIGLHGIQVVHISYIKSVEIDQLARSINFRLKSILRLPQHGCSINRLTIRTRNQVGSFQKDCRSAFPIHVSPCRLGFQCSINSHLHMLFATLVIMPQQVLMIVWRANIMKFISTHFFPVYYHRNVETTFSEFC